MRTRYLLPLIIAIILPLALTSCADAGEPLVDKNANVSVCYANAYDTSGNLLLTTILREGEAEELYRYFATSGYMTRLGDVAPAAPYITASFEKATESGEYDGIIEFAVYANDKVELGNEIIGRLDGVYSMLSTKIIEKRTKVKTMSLCSVFEYDRSGEEIDREDLLGRLPREIFDRLDNGTYFEDPERVDKFQAYYTVSFAPYGVYDTESGELYDYRIYEDDYVMRYNIFEKECYVALGCLDGIYDVVRDAVAEEKAIQKAESEAGFEFNKLMVQASKLSDFDFEDFAEINCISVSHLMDDENYLWWTIRIESESEEETLKAKQLLEARDDIYIVCLNYKMRIDY